MGAQTVGLNHATAIAGVSLAESGSTGDETFTVTLTDTHGLLSASGQGVSGSGTTKLTITGSLEQVNADLATLSDTDPSSGSDPITLTATDSFGNRATTQTIAVTASGGPVLTVPSGTQTIALNHATAIAGVSLAESGSTSDETFTVTLTDTHGLLSASGQGVSGSGTTKLTITGSLEQVNADLATLSDTDPSSGSDPITLTATDSFGNRATTQTIAVTASGGPVLTVPSGAQTIALNHATAIAGVSLAESGSTGDETFTVTLTDTHGLLSASGQGVSGSGTTKLTITGSLEQVNADLATLSDTDPSSGSDPITLTANDSFGNRATTQTIAVTASGGPVLTVPSGTQTIALNHATAIAGVSLAESGSTGDETFTVTLTDTHGLLSASGQGVSGSGTTKLTITGSLEQVNADLATLSDTDPSSGSDPITLTATDSFGNRATTQTIAVTASGGPVLTVPGAQTIALNHATAIAGVSLAESGSTGDETFTVTLTDTHGLLSASGQGVSGSGTTKLTITGSLEQVNADLATLSDTDPSSGSDTITLTATRQLRQQSPRRRRLR